MREERGNIWDLIGKYDAICVTTNGVVKANGECVMGKGIALQANQKFKGIARVLGEKINEKGNHAHRLGVVNGKTEIVSFPTKNNWKDNSDINLIKRSAKELVCYADKMNWENIALTRPGCGNGGLSWNDISLELAQILDDRFLIMS